jgi:hypothetical protein
MVVFSSVVIAAVAATFDATVNPALASDVSTLSVESTAECELSMGTFA